MKAFYCRTLRPTGEVFLLAVVLCCTFGGSAVAEVPQPAIITAGSFAVALPDAAADPSNQIFLSSLPYGQFRHPSPVGAAFYGFDRALMYDAIAYPRAGIYVIDVSTGALLDEIPAQNYGFKGIGTIAVSPDQSVALASGEYPYHTPPFYLYAIRAPFDHESAISRIQLPERVVGERHAIVFDKRGRGFVRHRGGISVIDPPYAAISFTIPVFYATDPYFGNIPDVNSGDIAIAPDGNSLLVTSVGWSYLADSGIYSPSPDGNQVQIFHAPFSASSTPEAVTIHGSNGGPDGFYGIEIAPDGQTAIVTGSKYEGYDPNYRRHYDYVFTISAPFSAGSAVGQIQLPAGYDDPENLLSDVGISGDSKVAIVTGHTGPLVIHAPFNGGSATSTFQLRNEMPHAFDSGGLVVRFRPPGITISKYGPPRIGPNEKITYTLTYSNNGPEDAINFTIRDQLPEGTKFVSATDGGQLIGDTVVFDMGTVFVGTKSQVSFTVEVTSPPGSVITNTDYTAGATNFALVSGPLVRTFMVSGDLLIKEADEPDTAWSADGIYLPDPRGDQFREAKFVPRAGATKEFDVELQNDAKIPRSYQLSGSNFGSRSWKVEALFDGIDRWQEMRQSGFSPGTMAPGAKLRFKVRVGAADSGKALPINSYTQWSIQATAAGSSQVQDSVGAMVQAVPIEATLRRPDAEGLTVESIEAGKNSIDAPLIFKTDTEALRAEPKINHGLVADGVTPLLFEITGPRDGSRYNVAAEIVGGGTLSGPPIAERLRILKEGQWSSSSLLTFNPAQETQFAYLTPVGSDEVILNTGATELRLRLVFTEVDTGDFVAEKVFQLRKPPVALVHGYNTDGAWGENFAAILGSSRSRLTEEGLPDFIRTIRYGQSPADGGQTEKQNTVLPFSDLVPILDREYTTMRSALSSGWAMTRHDVVCHSQGGILTRLLCSKNGNVWMPSPFRNPDNFNRGRFHRIVTIGSPHNGTRLVRYMLAMQDRFAQLGGVRAALAIPGAVADLLVGNGTAQDKFDPTGPQITAINRTDPTAPWFPDPAARFHLVQTTVNHGEAPSASSFSLADLGLGLETTGSLVIPRGSDGVVDFDSMGATAPDAGEIFPANVFRLPTTRQVSHAFIDVNVDLRYFNSLKPVPQGVPVDLFGGEDGQVDSVFVAEHVIGALDQRSSLPASERVFDSFRLPARLPQSVVDQVDAAADRVTPAANAIKLVTGSSAPKRSTQSTAGLAAALSSSSFQYKFDPPPGTTLSGPVTWSAERYGIDGVSAKGFQLQAVPGDSTRITVTVDTREPGDVMLYGTGKTTDGNIIVGAPVLVSSVEPDPAVFSLTGIEVQPAGGEFSLGGTLQPILWAHYICSNQACPAAELRLRRWIDPAEFQVNSSAPNIVDVTEPRLWKCSAIGSAQVSATWRGKTAASTFVIYDSAAAGVDTDGDGVSDARESAIPPGSGTQGDGNADSTQDSQQSNVASLLGVTGSWSTLVAPAGTSLKFVQPSGPPSVNDIPAGYTFPVGFIRFTVKNVPAGGSISTANLYPIQSFFTTVLAYGPTPDNVQPHWYPFLYNGSTGAQINGGQLVLRFTDGSAGDHDLQPNGEITTILAPAIASSDLADLSLSHSVAPQRVRRTQNVTYTITATNNGPAPAANARIVDHLPPSLAFVSATSGCSAANGTVTCELGSIEAGASRAVSVVGQATETGTITTTASVAAQNELNSTNDSSAAVLIVDPAPVAMSAYASSGPVPIPPDMQNFTSTAESPITVSGVTSALSKVRVHVHINHPYDSDLDLSLVSPDGTIVDLSLGNGGRGVNYGTDCPADGNDTTFDDQAITYIYDAAAPFVGEFRPQGSLSAFAGKTAAAVNGTWTLRVKDNCACEGGGSIECWSLDLATEAPMPTLPVITRFSPPNGLPGSTVTLFGWNFTGTTATQFNGAAASFTVVSDSEIITTVPAMAQTGAISVTNETGSSATSSHFTVLSDADADGMPDEFERQYFGSAISGNADIDSDGDGTSNLAEYHAGTNPLDPRSVFRVTAVRQQGNDIIIAFEALADKRYRVEASDTISANYPISVATLAPAASNSVVEVRDVDGANRPRRFYRVVVVP